MADDPKALAVSMINMYGDGAEQMARDYVERHRRSGDKENQAIWTQIVAYLTTRKDELKG